MIDFSPPKPLQQISNVVRSVAENMMRPVARYFDENEHEIPWDYINFMHSANQVMGANTTLAAEEIPAPKNEKREPLAYQRLAVIVEMLAWGDAGLYLCTPGGMLGSAAVVAGGTPQQKQRFLSRFSGDKPIFDALCMTESQAGSDTSAIRTRAVLDEATNEWVLNGEKIFVTAGHKALIDSNGFIVVWATIDPAAGRAGMRSFVVEAGTPGCTVTKIEKKLGIRASDTVSILLQDCRVPCENMLGSLEIDKQARESYKDALATFNIARPLVGAQAVGIARAALEFVKAALAKNGVTIRYGLPRLKLTAIERDVIEMESHIHAAWLLILKAVWMADHKIPNRIAASAAKLKAGDVVNRVTQKAVEIMGPLGYSREFLLEKWFRDAKIADIYEGTGQINRLVVARAILDYSSKELT
jgi:acyl-CoA dehydrogenase